MDVALFAARLTLASVFALSGVTKLADRAGSRKAMLDFGVPSLIAGPLGRVVPGAELAVALALFTTSTAWWGSIAALVLLGVFTLAILVNLARGRTPYCHCFGTLTSEPIGWTSLARNGVLLATAGFLAAAARTDSGPSTVGWIGELSAIEALALANGVAAVGIGGFVLWLLVQISAQNARLLLRLDGLETRLSAQSSPLRQTAPPAAPGLPVGSPAPAFLLPDLTGEEWSLKNALTEHGNVLLAFVDPACAPCVALLPDLSRWQSELAGRAQVVAVSRGRPEDNRPKAEELGLQIVVLQSDREVAKSYGADATPSAVLVTADGTIGSPLAQGADQIVTLVAQVGGGQVLVPPAATAGAAVPCPNCGQVHGANGAKPLPALAIGEPAPGLALPDLNGRVIELKSFLGKPVLVLFWNPACGYCQHLLDEMKTWESSRPEDSPELIVVSTGSPEANRALGFQAPVVLDAAFGVGGTYGAQGTPSAVLVDAKGMVAAPLAVGADAILGLIQANASVR